MMRCYWAHVIMMVKVCKTKVNDISVTDARSHFRLPIVPPLAKTQPCSRGVRSHGQRLPSPVFFCVIVTFKK